MPSKRDVIAEVHEAFNADELKTIDPIGESPSLARVAVDAVLDLHSQWQMWCYECSRRRAMKVIFPCETVKVVLKAAGLKE